VELVKEDNKRLKTIENFKEKCKETLPSNLENIRKTVV